MRSWAPVRKFGFKGRSPFALPNVIEVSEGIPFIDLTDWQHDKLYSLKGEVVRRGVEQITGLTMPVFEKRRFQHGLRSSVRLQRLTTLAAGHGWAALPSTGIAHTLFGVRLYTDQLLDELRVVDELVAGCYVAFPHFRLWSAWCMLYFAAVTSMEQADSLFADRSFLQADDMLFRDMLIEVREGLRVAAADGSAVACERFEDRLRCLIQPWNVVGLMDASCGEMYPQTAAN